MNKGRCLSSGTQALRPEASKFSILCLLCGFIPIFALPCHAASGTEGAAFLDIPVGAGPAAMGSAYSALADNAYAPVWNPAGLGFLAATQIAAQHLDYLQSIHYEYLSVVHPIADGKSLGASAQYLGSGDISGTDVAGNSIGNYSTHYGAYSVAYGQKLGEKLSLGLTGKWINAQLADVSANAYAMDLGALYQMQPNLRLAATLTNLGTKLTFTDQSDSLPLAGHLAAAYQPQRHWNLVVEGIYDNTGAANVRTGIEWKPLEAISIRTGYRTDTTKELSALAGFTTGLGVHVWGQELAYAWVPYGDLGNIQYFSLLVQFGRSKEEERNLIQYETIKRQRTVKGSKMNPGTSDKSDEDYQQLMQLLQEGKEPVAQSGSPEKRP